MPQAAVAKILLVEDEFLIQDMVESTLQDAGYAVVSVDDGAGGLAAVEREAGLAGLVCDVNLGSGPNGWEVAARAREIHPTLPVVYISGDSAHEWSARGVPRSIMVSKPFAGVEVIVALANLRASAE